MPADQLPQPDVVAHADWSMRASKRWICIAVRDTGRYVVAAPELFGEPTARLRSLAAGRRSGLLGVDFPIGLPAHYARRVGIASYVEWLRDRFDAGTFADPAGSPGEISVERPFYPERPGGARHAHLVEALGAVTMDDLRRVCERHPPLRRAACPLFWTLGANQVGKAAVSGWSELLDCRTVAVWPFDGDLGSLVDAGGLVVAETYPAACAEFLGLGFRAGESKRRQRDRAARADGLLFAATALRADFDPILRRRVLDGFGSSSNGEDPFDATVGLLGMLHVLAGRRPPGPPRTVPEACSVEGWILGV